MAEEINKVVSRRGKSTSAYDAESIISIFLTIIYNFNNVP